MNAGDTILGRFDILVLADAGGMGSIYRATDRTSGRVVAIKTLRVSTEKVKLRFLREAKMLAALDHPGIVAYIAHGTSEDGTPFLAMEWVDGVPLSKVIAKGAMDIAAVIAMGRSIAETLAWAHAMGVVHRDVKPSNLLLEGRDPARVKLLDFGIARDGGPALTGAQTMLGTPAFMAPEQVRGERGLDGRADLFALGCVLFKATTGRAAFAGSDATAVLAKVLFEQAQSVRALRPDAPLALSELIKRLLEKEPANRPQRASDVATALAAIEVREDLSATTRSATSLAAPEVLTEHEQVLLSVVLCKLPKLDPDASDPMQVWKLQLQALRGLAEQFGARFEILAHVGAMAVLSSHGSAIDQAIMAARCATTMRDALPDAAFVLSTGRGEMAALRAVGEVIEQAVSLQREAGAQAGRIAIDAITASLVRSRFDVRADGAQWLVAERLTSERPSSAMSHALAFVGREQDVERLQAMYAEVVARREAACVVIVGAPGLGKSRMVQEAFRTLASDRPEIFFARADALRRNVPLAPLKPMLRRAAGASDADGPEDGHEKLLVRLTRHMDAASVARAGPFLADMAGLLAANSAEDDRVRAARRVPSVMFEQTTRAWLDFIVAEASAHPVALVFEDLHHADSSTVALLQETLRRASALPLFVVVTTRPEGMDQYPLLARHPAVRSVTLSELTTHAAGQLARATLGDDASPDVIDRVVARAGGNALYLEELLRAEALGQGERTPVAVVAMVQARLQALEPDARRVLRAASVLGFEFADNGVIALLGEDDHDVRANLESLIAGEVLSAVESPSNDLRYSFRHDVVREAAYAMLTDEDRSAAHRIAASWLESRGDDDAALVAEHFARGGEPHQAAQFFARAAEIALERNDCAGCVSLAERAIACGVDRATKASLRLSEAEAHCWRGDLALAETCATDAMELAVAGSETYFRAGCELIVASGRQAKMEAVARTGRALLSATARPETGGALAMALARAASVLAHVQRGEAESLLTAMDDVIAKFDRPDLLVVARANEAHANMAMAQGDLEQYVSRMSVAALSFEVAGSDRAACITHVNLGYTNMQLGLVDDAVSALEAALVQASELGLTYVENAARHNLGLALARAGRVDEGILMERGAISMAKERGDTRIVGASRAYLARMLLERGDVHAAEGEARAAAHLLSAEPSALAMALAVYASALLAAGRPQEAMTSIARALAVQAELGHVDEADTLVQLVRVRALNANGESAAAREALASALERLRARAEKIHDPTVRAAFLDRVPENQALLKLEGGARS